MQVLTCLCRQPGEVLSADAIIEEVWDNRPMGDNPVYKAIAKLRRALDDDAGEAETIQTVPKKGYRLVAPVRAHDPKTPEAPNETQTRQKHWRVAGPVLVGILLGTALAAGLFWRPATTPPELAGISTFPGSHRQPTFAPDGETVAFISSAGGTSQRLGSGACRDESLPADFR